MNEQWRAIADYPDYEVSDLGRVRRTTTRTCAKAGTILKTPLRSGYPCVDLSRPGDGKKTHHIHRLVAAAFLGEPPAGAPEVNHINGSKTDNAATNLEYVSSSENQLHAYRVGLQSAEGQKNGQAKLTEDDVRQIREIAARWDRPTIGQIGAKFGVSAATVHRILRGDGWTHVAEAKAS